jgi:hypothetical protein
MLVILLVIVISMGEVYEHQFHMADTSSCDAVSAHLHEVLASDFKDDGAASFSIQCVENVNE